MCRVVDSKRIAIKSGSCGITLPLVCIVTNRRCLSNAAAACAVKMPDIEVRRANTVRDGRMIDRELSVAVCVVVRIGRRIVEDDVRRIIVDRRIYKLQRDREFNAENTVESIYAGR